MAQLSLLPARRQRAGTTLVEVVVAIMIVAVAALLVAGSVSASVASNAFAREHGVALEAARTQLESLTSQPLQVVFSLPNLLLFSGSTFPVDGLSGPNGGNAGSIRIDPSGAPVVTIEVTVSWVGSLGPDQVSLTTSVLVTGSLP
jgi:type II secretory pathway pseudopilin PulG